MADREKLLCYDFLLYVWLMVSVGSSGEIVNM